MPWAEEGNDLQYRLLLDGLFSRCTAHFEVRSLGCDKFADVLSVLRLCVHPDAKYNRLQFLNPDTAFQSALRRSELGSGELREA